MPIYEYRCPECGNEFESIRPVSRADDPIECKVMWPARRPPDLELLIQVRYLHLAQAEEPSRTDLPRQSLRGGGRDAAARSRPTRRLGLPGPGLVARDAGAGRPQHSVGVDAGVVGVAPQKLERVLPHRHLVQRPHVLGHCCRDPAARGPSSPPRTTRTDTAAAASGAGKSPGARRPS